MLIFVVGAVDQPEVLDTSWFVLLLSSDQPQARGIGVFLFMLLLYLDSLKPLFPVNFSLADPCELVLCAKAARSEYNTTIASISTALSLEKKVYNLLLFSLMAENRVARLVQAPFTTHIQFCFTPHRHCHPLPFRFDQTNAKHNGKSFLKVFDFLRLSYLFTTTLICVWALVLV